MPIGSFAGKVFEVDSERIYTFADLQYNSALQTEKQEAEGKKPSTYNKGPDLDSMTFKIKLDASLGVNPRSEWEEWQILMNESTAYPFILGSKPLGDYNWLLVNVSPSNFIIDNSGNILSVDLSLQFDEYVRPGSKKDEKKSSKSSPGIAGSKYKDLEIEILSPYDKAKSKRVNSGMIRASNELR